MQSSMISVEVAYATPQKSWLIDLEVEADSTVAEAIKKSGILTQCPMINLQENKIGIFSKIVDLETPLRGGDRIEIYRPLILDPKQARRLRAEKVKTKKVGKEKTRAQFQSENNK